MSAKLPAIDDAVVEDLARARSVLVVTGAGMSADSGLPTYRGIGGLYHDADTEDGVPIEEALSGTMLRSSPAVTWKHIARIEAACRGAGPNEGHRVLARFESRFERFVILTQNVDALHTVAGSKDVIEIHGDIHHLRCTQCSSRRTVSSYEGMPIPPSCGSCGGLERPEVVLFGEMLPPLAVSRLESEVTRGFDVVMSIGTTSVFPYIAWPVEAAAHAGKCTIEINPGVSEVSHLVRHRIRTRAAETLVALERRLGA